MQDTLGSTSHVILVSQGLPSAGFELNRERKVTINANSA